MNIEDKNSDNATQQFFGGSGALSKSKRLGVRHAMGRNWYLFKVEWYLESKVSGRRRKSILADLREGIGLACEKVKYPTLRFCRAP
ncbi:hypothetical protein [Arthrobacter psychrochitiniphilus]|uniref:Uncharacterized protein n=1 Tax=Arthrobacter psychrochitiniphilus TaxID=291045 RepID=A0A2V3DPY3_9MICC|nr:hypothetical protein [Arthrobacter psychrochitiniphilus]NYG17023.1 hypothetical protein [Arthrobacter psychrochitiniphilus]PXA64761.1 hypothetical protein CVS29_13150 [Arthrobacter psychrochitiniphilus]